MGQGLLLCGLFADVVLLGTAAGLGAGLGAALGPGLGGGLGVAVVLVPIVVHFGLALEDRAGAGLDLIVVLHAAVGFEEFDLVHHAAVVGVHFDLFPGQICLGEARVGQGDL